MQKITIEKVNPGAVIAKDIFDDDGVMLLSKGTTFRPDFVERLSEAEIKEIYIEHQKQDEPSFLDSIKKNTTLNNVIYEKTRVQAQKQVKKLMTKFSQMGRVEISKISSIVNEILDQLLSQQDIVLTLSSLRSIDDYTYEHSVNVSVLSLIVGIDMNLDKDSLKKLGVGAMLHDIGKVVIPEDILKKPSALTRDEYNEIKKHTDYGYDILCNSDISEEAASIALYHHERFDGNGYNRKITGKNIPLFSRIVAVTDVYDAMSNDRVYKRKLSPDNIYKEIMHQGNKQFDAEIIEKFISHISLYPVGTGVILNTNHKGIVIAQNKFMPESPIVRVIKKDDNKISAADVDLSKTKHLYIKDTY